MKSVLNLFSRKRPETTAPIKPKPNSTLKNMFNKHSRNIAHPTHLCSYYPSTTRTNTKLCPGLRLAITQNRTGQVKKITNKNAKSLEPGVYLFLIMYNTETEKFTIMFSQVESRQELMSRHFLMANINKPHTKFVVAAGELKKFNGGHIIFNLLSGTFMEPLLNQYKRIAKTNVTDQVKNLVKNVLNTKASYVNKELIPQVNTNLNNIIKTRGVKINLPSRLKRKRLPQIDGNLKGYVNWITTTHHTRSKGPIKNSKYSIDS